MSDEEKEITLTLDKKKTRLWITMLCSIIGVLATVGIGVCIYNSDWYINQTMSIRELENEDLGKNIKWNYGNKYEKGKLKIHVELLNVDKKMFQIAKQTFDEGEWIIKVLLSDKDKYRLKELPISIEKFTAYEDESTYIAQIATKMSKEEVREIKYIQAEYRVMLDKKYGDVTNELRKQYGRTVDKVMKNLYGI